MTCFRPRLARLALLTTLSLLILATLAHTAAYGVLRTTNQTRPTPSLYTVSDDPATGKITVESRALRIIWGYKPLKSEFNNRSGGSIYGLFDKTVDPRCELNLVQIHDWGSGSSTPSHAGIGGLGATKSYVRYSSKAITEVGTHADLLSRSVTTLDSGAAQLSFTYRVKDWDNVATYTIKKVWTVQPNGTIRLKASWYWLIAQVVNDPNYDFAFNRDYGWTRLGWLTHRWWPTICDGPGSNGLANLNNAWVYDAVVSTEDDEDYGTYHVQKYRFDGAPSGVVATVAVNPSNGGFENSGLFKFGYKTWYPEKGIKAIQQITGEFSNYRTRAYGSELRWGSWFSNDGGSTRFRRIPAGTTWSDVFTISLTHE